jgi:uncharacterized membrane protein
MNSKQFGIFLVFTVIFLLIIPELPTFVTDSVFNTRLVYVGLAVMIVFGTVGYIMKK